MSKQETKAFIVRLPADLKHKLEKQVDYANSQNAIIIKALTEYLAKK